MTDSDLVLAARRRDAAAWATLVERHDRVLRSVCRAHRLSWADAEDIRQTTWLRALEHVDRLNDPERVAAWLATVARHECRRALKRARRTHPADSGFEEHADTSPPVEAGLLADERRAAVRRALDALSPRDRAMLRLLFFGGDVSYAAVGRALDMPTGSVGPTRERVLERLRRRAPIAALAA